MTKKVADLKKKSASTTKEIEAVNSGKILVQTLFKADKNVDSLENKVNVTDSEIEWQIKLADLLTVYLGENCISQYKKEKLDMYRKIMQIFHVSEINNKHKMMKFWAQMLNDPNVK